MPSQPRFEAVSRSVVGVLFLSLSLVALTARGDAQQAQSARQAQQTQAQPAADAQQPPKPTFRVEANYVRVDVYPTVKGQPVRDLTKDDFEIFEDGQLQKVDQFEFIEIRGNVPEPVKREPQTVAESREMAQDPRARVFIVFLDTYHTGIAGSNRMRSALATLLTRILGPDDLVGFMTPRMSAKDVTLARRTEAIESALSKYWDWGIRDQRNMVDEEEEAYLYCYPRDTSGVTRVAGDPRTMEQGETVTGVAQEMIERRREKITLEALDDLVGSLRGIREERKAVITVTDGWRLFRPNSALANSGSDRAPSLPGIGVGPTGRLTSDVGAARNGDVRSKCEMDRMMLSNIDNESEFRALLNKANRANVTFYPVDSRGLPVFDNSIEGPIGRPMGLGMSPVADQAQLRQRTTSLQVMAAETDGIAVVNSNDIERGLSRIVADVGSYYLLGYYSANDRLDGKFRSIKVRVKRPGVDVRARKGYLAARENEIAEAETTAAAAPVASPEVAAVERAIGNLAGLRPNTRVRSQVSWLLRPDAASPMGRVWAIAEIDRNLARDPEWTAGAKVDVTLTTDNGTKLGATAIDLAAGQRVAEIEFNDIALPAGDALLRMRIAPAGGGLPLVESVRFTVPADAPTIGGPRIWRRGPTTGTQFKRTGDAAFQRNEWIRVEVPMSSAADRVEAEVLDRTGKPVKMPVKSTLVPVADGLGWAVAEVALAPLAAADYAIRVTTTAGTTSTSTVTGFRIVP